MKEQWKRLDSDAKQLVDAEEGRSTPIKIEVPVIPITNTNDGDYCKRLIATLRVCVLLALLVLLIWHGIVLYAKVNVQSVNDHEEHSIFGHQALISGAWFNDPVEDGNESQADEYTKQELNPKDKIHSISQHPPVDNTPDKGSRAEESSVVSHPHISEDVPLTPRSFDSAKFESPEVENLPENHLNKGELPSHDESQNWNEMRNTLKHIEQIVVENQKMLSERLADEKFDEISVSESDESTKDRPRSDFMNHLLADMIVAAEKELEKNKVEQNPNGEQMIVEVPEPRIIDHTENPLKRSEFIKNYRFFPSMSPDVLMWAGVLPPSDESMHLHQRSKGPELISAEKIDPVSSAADTTLSSDIEKGYGSTENEDDGILGFIASGLLSPFASRSVEAENSTDKDEPHELINEGSTILPNFDRVDFWNKFWEKRHLNRFVKLITPIVGNKFELLTWYKNTESTANFKDENDQLKVHVAKLLYSTNIKEFDEDAVIVTNLIPQNPGFQDSINSEELEEISSDTATSQIALLLFEKAKLNELLRTGEIDESVASKSLEDSINSIEDLVRFESEYAEHMKSSNTRDEEISDQPSLRSSEKVEESESRDETISAHPDQVSRSEDETKVRNEYVIPQVLPLDPLRSRGNEMYEGVPGDRIINFDQSSIHDTHGLHQPLKEVRPLEDVRLGGYGVFREMNEDNSGKLNEYQDRVLPHHEEVLTGAYENTGVENTESSNGPFHEMLREFGTFLESPQNQGEGDSKYLDGPYLEEPFFDDLYY